MSRYHVPVPDYDFTIRQKNPYIPTPDYTTIKSNKIRNRPSLNAIGTEFENSSNLLHVDTEFGIQQEPSNAPRAQRKYRASQKPRLPDINSNFDEIKKHSYIEDREEDEEEHHRSTKEHIKHIGVPVIPGINRPLLSISDIAVAPVSSDQNKAYLRHLENHKKFDTVRGDRGIENCEICQIMKKQCQAEYEQSHYQDFSNELNQLSNSKIRRRPTDIRKVFTEPHEQDVIRARALYDYQRKHEQEISVNAMEIVEIVDLQRGFALCRKADNEIGWIPAEIMGI